MVAKPLTGTPSSAERGRSSSAGVFRRPGVLLIAVAAVAAAQFLNTFSYPAGATIYGLLAAGLLGLVAVIWWAVVATKAVARRRLTAGLIVAPTIGLLTVGLLQSDLSTLRFKYLDRPGFDAIVAGAPAPVVPATESDANEDGYYGEFPSQCPAFIGTLRIYSCQTFAAGYIFYQGGTAGVNDGGLAYMPEGEPSYYVGNGGFEDPTFVHLAGPWYAFTSSW